jgi:mono/diheme cytochrome c family protein
MKKSIWLSIQLIPILVLSSSVLAAEGDEWVAPARANRQKNPVASSAESLAQGKKVFTANCMSCHGPEGKGDGPAAKDLQKKPGNLSDSKLWKQADGALFWKVTEGKAPMPTFEKLISEEDRWHVINFVRTLSPKPTADDDKKQAAAADSKK